MQPIVVFDFIYEAVSIQQACDPEVLAVLELPPDVFATTDATPPLELPPPAS